MRAPARITRRGHVAIRCNDRVPATPRTRAFLVACARARALACGGGWSAQTHCASRIAEKGQGAAAEKKRKKGESDGDGSDSEDDDADKSKKALKKKAKKEAKVRAPSLLSGQCGERRVLVGAFWAPSPPPPLTDLMRLPLLSRVK